MDINTEINITIQDISTIISKNGTTACDKNQFRQYYYLQVIYLSRDLLILSAISVPHAVVIVRVKILPVATQAN